jgi:hypothetical protein
VLQALAVVIDAADLDDDAADVVCDVVLPKPANAEDSRSEQALKTQYQPLR